MVFAITGSVYVLVRSGQFRTITPAFNGLCAAVYGVVGAEDILIHPSGDFAFISSDNRRARKLGHPSVGAIYRYDLKNPNIEPVNLTPEALADFQPLGLTFFQDDKGRETLMVINRRSQAPSKEVKNQVNIYSWEEGGLNLTRIVTGPELLAPNDLVAVDHDRFYITNDQGYAEGPLAAIESFLPLPVGSVYYFDGQGFSVAAGGFSFANGINKSLDGSKIYVAATVGQTLSVFDRDIATGSLTLNSETALGTGPDNITLDADGNIWIAAHPQLLSFVGFVSDETKYTPSQVMRLVPGIGGHLIPEDVMMDAGDLISGASVAAAVGNRFLVGSAYEKKILDCTL